MNRDKHCLTRVDIACLEHLCGHSLPDALKRYLLQEYGPGSCYEELNAWAKTTIKACRKADDRCDALYGGCDACAFEATDSLLERVFRIIYCYEQGRFDLSKHDYRDAVKALSFQLSFTDECADWVF